MNQTSLKRTKGRNDNFGHVLRAWRKARNQSQLALALDAGVSPRHLSYMETGKASPSRGMVLSLARALEMPLRDRNALLEAAGFAAMYRETPLKVPAMGPIRDALQFMLEAMEHNPAFLVNRRYDVLDSNAIGQHILTLFSDDLARFDRPLNIGLLLASPLGMKKYVENWREVGAKVFGRIKRDLGGPHTRDQADEAVMRQIEPALAEIGEIDVATKPLPFFVGVDFARDALGLKFFTTIATVGTPQDVTLQELRIETLFPADQQTRNTLLALLHKQKTSSARLCRVGRKLGRRSA
jgi:transcriptional regulator with XRE-family HTH domain